MPQGAARPGDLRPWPQVRSWPQCGREAARMRPSRALQKGLSPGLGRNCRPLPSPHRPFPRPCKVLSGLGRMACVTHVKCSAWLFHVDACHAGLGHSLRATPAKKENHHAALQCTCGWAPPMLQLQHTMVTYWRPPLAGCPRALPANTQTSCMFSTAVWNSLFHIHVPRPIHYIVRRRFKFSRAVFRCQANQGSCRSRRNHAALTCRIGSCTGVTTPPPLSQRSNSSAWLDPKTGGYA